MSTRYLYVIGGDTGPLKVGISDNPFRRIVDMQTTSPKRLELYAAWATTEARGLEREVHTLLSRHRAHGEWFNVSRQEVFTAVMQALSRLEKWVEKPKEKVVRHYETPAAQVNFDEEKHPMGYVRAIQGVSAGRQVAWLEKCGVHPDSIWIEMNDGSWFKRNSALRDARKGDLFYVWSTSVLGDGEDVAVVRADLASKGVPLIFDQSQPDLL